MFVLNWLIYGQLLRFARNKLIHSYLRRLIKQMPELTFFSDDNHCLYSKKRIYGNILFTLKL